ncbi:MAG: hypothetical protein IPK85_11120 [Gemmatimonadetes bacterium]|nr:hypothetical protein [Gemmatimonadota bacterium]
MFAAATLLFLQSVSVTVGQDKAARDSLRREALRDSIRRQVVLESDQPRRPVRRVPVTPEHLRTAFRDSAARQLLVRAREARLTTDSTLLAYDATAYQRLSTGLGFRATGRDRLLFRTENASRVRWSRSNGLHVDVKGRRTVFPMAEEEAGEVNLEEMGPIPYYPGREALWVGSGIARAEVDESEMVHPIATGSEAYYIYSAGDSLTITLSDGKAIRLRELRIEPRRPEWKFSVGSFWFDQDGGQLVRAVYRFATAMNIWAVADAEIEREKQERLARGEKWDPDEEVPGWVKGFMSPMEANLEAVTVEYGLYGGRYWLPRTQYAEGHAKASFMRIPFKLEESFKYASVNGTDSLPPQARRLSLSELRDSLFGDTTRFRDLPDSLRKERSRIFAQVDSTRRAERIALRKQECATSGMFTRTESRFNGQLRATVRVPCSDSALANAPELAHSIYEPGEELFGLSERNELLKALDFSLQPVWAPMPIRTEWGMNLMRYNRVEGFSAAAKASQNLGKGISWDATGRLGTADHSVYGELGVARSNGRHTYRAGAYRRLVASNGDWGSPLSFGAAFGALAYGRDEGYYHRASGVEVERSLVRGGGLQVRGFLERQHNASWNTRFNLSRAMGSSAEFQPNITAERTTIAGISLRQQLNHGLDPAHVRLFGDVRAEGGAVLDRARGDSAPGAYLRVAGDLTMSRQLVGKLAGALTLGAGYSDGAPLQRQFFLGGAQTVRGQLLGSAAGEAYWLGRAELGRDVKAIRQVVFGDVGWAGPWSTRSTPGRPLSGVGVGTSFLDGLIRFDLSRGLYPRKKMRFDMYVEARF